MATISEHCASIVDTFARVYLFHTMCPFQGRSVDGSFEGPCTRVGALSMYREEVRRWTSKAIAGPHLQDGFLGFG